MVLFGFPDTIWEPVDGFQHLVAELGEVVLGLFRCRDLTGPTSSPSTGRA